MVRKLGIGLLCMVIAIAAMIPAEAFAPAPSEFYGAAIVDGAPIPAGSIVEVYDKDNVLCGRTEVKKEGLYGFLSCNADDEFTAKDEGARQNEVIVFFIDGRKAKTTKPAVWLSSTQQEIGLFVGSKPFVEEPSSRIVEYLFFSALTALSFFLIFIFIYKDKKKYKL